MKKLIALLLVLCSTFASAAPNDIVLTQRNSTNTGDILRLMSFPSGAEGIFWLNATTVTPAVLTLGSNMSVSSGVLDSVPPTWSTLASKPSFATVAFTGNYGDLTGTPSPTTPSQAGMSRSLNSAFQISTTRGTLGIYSVQCTITASIAGGQNCDVIFEIASDSGFTTNVQTASICGDGQTYTLAVALQGVQPSTKVCVGFVPASYYARLRTVQNTGTPTFSYRAGQEVQF